MRTRRRALPRTFASVPSRTLCTLPLPPPPSPFALFSTCASQRFFVDVRERPWMWVSVLRAEVKSVARVAEVGRIRVTDQRAPRERNVGGALGLIESAYREQNSRSVYPIIRPPSFLNSSHALSPSLFRAIIGFFHPCLSRSSWSFPSRRAILSWLSCVQGFHPLSLPRSRFLLHSALSSPLVSLPVPSLSIPSFHFSLVSPFVLLASLFLVPCSLTGGTIPP